MIFQDKFWSKCRLLACAGALVVTTSTAFTQTTAKQGFETFRMVQSRNIFDPNRQPIRPASARPRPTAPVTRNDYASLTGTMVTPEKSLAFFSGTRAEYNKVLPVKGAIAGATITRIEPTQVEVERDGKRIMLAVGQALPLGAESAPATPPPAASPAAATPATTTASPEPIPPADAGTGASASPAPGNTAPLTLDRDALIKRMMERRQQQTK
jgi:hypothetical protein